MSGRAGEWEAAAPSGVSKGAHVTTVTQLCNGYCNGCNAAVPTVSEICQRVVLERNRCANRI